MAAAPAALAFKPFSSEEHNRFVTALEQVGRRELTGTEWQFMAGAVGRSAGDVKLHAARYLVAVLAVAPREVVKQVSAELEDGSWSAEETAVFEHALVAFPEGDEQRWAKVASLLPGKTAAAVEKRYQLLMMNVTRIELGEQAKHPTTTAR